MQCVHLDHMQGTNLQLYPQLSLGSLVTITTETSMFWEGVTKGEDPKARRPAAKGRPLPIGICRESGHP